MSTPAAVGYQRTPVRPLVVPVTPLGDDETMVSMLARSTRGNVLGTTQIILREVGLALAHPGTVGQEIGDLVPRLAEKIGCPPDAIAARTHEYIDGATGLVRFGDGVMRRSDLILDRRRVSPAALRRAPYARAAWQCRHLPYDPETLEQLIDACPHCGEGLRWSRAWGVAVCESCREEVLSAAPPGLDAGLADAYRAFAGLISIAPLERATACAGLAPALAALPQPALLDLIVGLGLALGPDQLPAGRRAIARLSDPQRAAAACRGMDLIEDWPNMLRSAVVDAWRAAEPTGGSGALLRALRSLGDGRAFSNEQSAAIRAALPEAFEDKRRALGGMEAPVVLSRDITRMAGISSSDVARLRDSEVLDVSGASGRLRQHGQFRLDQASDLAARRRGSVPVTTVEQWLGLPRYAVEQLIALGELEWESHPGILLLDDTPRVTVASLVDLRDRLEGVAAEEPRDDWVTLWAAARRSGGAPKAWGDIMAAIARGDPRVHAIAGAHRRPFVRRVAINPSALANFPPGSFRQDAPSGYPVATFVSQADACELLNLDALQIRPVIEAGVITLERQGKALVSSLTDVLAHAAAMIPAAEIGPTLGIRHDAVHARMRGAPGIAALPGGWNRIATMRRLPAARTRSAVSVSEAIIEIAARAGET